MEEIIAYFYSNDNDVEGRKIIANVEERKENCWTNNPE